jgi:hypothetical protein
LKTPDRGKVVLSKKSRNKQEELVEKIAVKKDGYIETFLVKETSENVWFDKFRVMSMGPLIVQETHGACPDERIDIGNPWGVELSGLGYQYGGKLKEGSGTSLYYVVAGLEAAIQKLEGMRKTLTFF